jgi:hypothetical protein
MAPFIMRMGDGAVQYDSGVIVWFYEAGEDYV